MKIFITSYCDNLELEKAALLTLSTLRIGFPTVEDVTCLWAGGLESVREKAQAICEQNGIEFCSTVCDTNDKAYKRVIHGEYGEVVLLDSDVIFWSECESFQPSENVAGRWIPGHFCSYTRSWTVQRVHPSFLWIKSVEKLRSDILTTNPNNSRFTHYDPIAPVTVRSLGEGFYFYDTLANLPVPIQHFDADMLDRYDHLFCGSFVNLVSPELLATHKAIYANPLLAKGIWRKQDEYFYGTCNSR